MKNKDQINKEIKEVYNGIVVVILNSDVDYCISWWLNRKNFQLESKLSTREINQRAKHLVKNGYLTIDNSKFRKHCGICYKLTDKKLN